MKIEIWSDVICPFCYIGKRRFERALALYGGIESVDIQWKTFLLNPGLKTDPVSNLYQSLSKQKGISIEEAKSMGDYVVRMAKDEGLHYNFEKTVVANSLNAHRLLHLAKRYGKQQEAKERLLEAYFIGGINIDDYNSLINIGKAMAFDQEVVYDVLVNKHFTEAIEYDIKEAQHLGIRGVPFFLFNRKYAVSGAQDDSVFKEIMRQVFVQN